MAMLKRIWVHLRVLGKARRNRSDLLGWLGRRPQILVAQAAYESALLLTARLDSELKMLATAKAAAMANCEFCIDIGSALAGLDGMDERKFTDLRTYRDSDAYSELERLVIAFAEAMSATPAIVPAELRDELLRHLSKAQLTELAAEVAWENQRARLNQALGVRPAGFADGAVCFLPETIVPPRAADARSAGLPGGQPADQVGEHRAGVGDERPGGVGEPVEQLGR
ncbi:MAG TPA: hypothetical protein VGJ44_10300, partial [Kribbellaceae bacterium]